ncbi:RNA ligase [Gordonia phage Stormageddon]|uniref:RNA ligase n=1 Tax=Gordonia phage Stormageddon TaxID=2656541 RepID=A0A649VQU7_9CAUD|nr:RNA ligase [Gordonia phage Stormageddon]QGJ94880.1 RNA ligase [Gordonia phage Stormageddon]
MERTADAEQAKRTGGMVALYPTPQSAARVLVAGGEPIEDLHLTIGYLGEDVSGYFSPVEAANAAFGVAQNFPLIQAKVMGHATFNPDGDEPCAVHLVGDNDYLPELYQFVQSHLHANYNLPRQHTPWIPHVTAGYGLTAADLSYTGPIEFDRVQVNWAEEVFGYDLLPPAVF